MFWTFLFFNVRTKTPTVSDSLSSSLVFRRGEVGAAYKSGRCGLQVVTAGFCPMDCIFPMWICSGVTNRWCLVQCSDIAMDVFGMDGTVLKPNELLFNELLGPLGYLPRGSVFWRLSSIWGEDEPCFVASVTFVVPLDAIDIGIITYLLLTDSWKTNLSEFFSAFPR